MKKLTIILAILFIAMVLSADDLEWRTGLHFTGGFAVNSFNHILLSNWQLLGLELTDESIGDVNFYLTFTELVVYEYWSNDWEGMKFWDFTGSIFGMVASRELFNGSRPRVYPKYYGQETIGLEFAFNF